MSITNLSYREPPKREIIDGKIYLMAPSPVPNHNRVVKKLTVIFDIYLEGKKCEVFGENVDVYFDEQNKEVKPDIKIVCNPSKITDTKIIGAPDLIVEVLSKYNPDHDKKIKMALYEKYGVREYWIINIPSREIEVYLLKDGKLVFDKTYGLITETDADNINVENAPELMEFIKTKYIKTSLYGDDLLIPIEKIFSDLK